MIGGTLLFCGPALLRGEADWAGVAGGLLSLVGAMAGVGIGIGVADTGLPATSGGRGWSATWPCSVSVWSPSC
ncbi:hypothetical protein [Streptomyces sp. NPDC054940]